MILEILCFMVVLSMAVLNMMVRFSWFPITKGMQEEARRYIESTPGGRIILCKGRVLEELKFVVPLKR